MRGLPATPTRGTAAAPPPSALPVPRNLWFRDRRAGKRSFRAVIPRGLNPKGSTKGVALKHLTPGMGLGRAKELGSPSHGGRHLAAAHPLRSRLGSAAPPRILRGRNQEHLRVSPGRSLSQGTGLSPLLKGLLRPSPARAPSSPEEKGCAAALAGGGGSPSSPRKEGEGCRKPGARCSPGHLLFFERFQLGLNERICLRDLSQNRSGFSILGYSRNPYFFRRKTS